MSLSGADTHQTFLGTVRGPYRGLGARRHEPRPAGGISSIMMMSHSGPYLIAPAGWAELYPYTADLLALDLCRPPPSPHHPLLGTVRTPLRAAAWASALAAHPDKAFVRYLLAGIMEGFRIGFRHPAPLRSAPRNMQSALDHPDVVQAYIAAECARGRMLGLFSPLAQAQVSLPPCHVNRFGVIPKGRNTGRWRLITDLSFPPGLSVNDGIDPDLCSLTYTSVDKVAEVIAALPQGGLLAKIDIESAYRLVLVHPLDRPLQAVVWGGAVYVDPMLPFGLRSAPKIFNALADGLEWYLRHLGVRYVFHYLDDFLVVGPPASPECAEALAQLNSACARLGVPIAEHKREGPTTCLTFLGIEVDTSPANSGSQPTSLIASNPFSRSGATRRRAGDATSNLSSAS